MSLNLFALEYISEVAKTGSISKAAQNLFLSQPHLSNTIKAVEKELGVQLFRRSAKGMALTEEGRVFVQEARNILTEVNALHAKLRIKPETAVRSRISATRSHQINRCITDFINRHAAKAEFQIHVKETNPFQVVEDVHCRESELGVLHFFDAQKEYFLNLFQRYSLSFQKHYQREFLVAMSKDNPLAKEETLCKEMLEEQIVVIYGDYEIPSASYETITKVSDIILSPKRIYVYDRAGAMETLSRCPGTYMWIAGLHPETLRQNGLVLRRCSDVEVINLGYSIHSLDEPLSWATAELFADMQKIDWTEEVR